MFMRKFTLNFVIVKKSNVYVIRVPEREKKMEFKK